VPLADESWNYHFHTICCLLWGIANRLAYDEYIGKLRDKTKFSENQNPKPHHEGAHHAHETHTYYARLSGTHL
jgi:hypothetical protein